jgi:hypothetical protein
MHEHRIWIDSGDSTENNLSFLREPSAFIEHRAYSNVSKTRDLSFALPPLGSARTLLHTKQAIGVVDFSNMICSFLHFGHRILMNFVVGFVFIIA